mmetsp:Transcript_10461/g.15799  ORF Transcript_10461/g.15799 Transcript_10461/m.15799 type:complete len:204 (-) Transcript_10461:960-1571(-)
MIPPVTTTAHHHHRRRAVIVCSLLSWTCALSTAFSPTHHLPSSVHTSSPTPHSPTPSNHHHSTTIKSSTHLHSLFTSSKTKKNSPLEDEPWKKDDSYWDQLQAASKDPEQFEKFIEETMAKKNKISSSSTSPSTSLSSAYDAAKQEEEEKPKKKKGAYVPIEQWDATRSKDDMTKEERLQWECQRGGNRVRQNEILMHNLKGF